MPTSRPARVPLVAPGQIDHQVTDMTVTASADLSLADLQRQLATHDQWLPIDGDPDASLRQLVEQNSTGPLRLGYGAWRDLLLGVQFTNGLGELITAGGRTVKNVAGYDLTKFMVGQGGVFGRLVTITTRTYRRPAMTLLARFGPDVRLVNQLMPTDLRPQWMMLTGDALLLGYLGDETTIRFYDEAVRALAPIAVLRRSLQEDVEHRAALWCCVGEMTLRAAVPPARVQEFVAAASPVSWAADAAFGIVLGTCSREACARVKQAAHDVGGSVYFRAADGTPRDVTASEGERKLLERLKQALDPDRRLAPLPWQQPSSPS